MRSQPATDSMNPDLQALADAVFETVKVMSSHTTEAPSWLPT